MQICYLLWRVYTFVTVFSCHDCLSSLCYCCSLCLNEPNQDDSDTTVAPWCPTTYKPQGIHTRSGCNSCCDNDTTTTTAMAASTIRTTKAACHYYYHCPGKRQLCPKKLSLGDVHWEALRLSRAHSSTKAPTRMGGLEETYRQLQAWETERLYYQAVGVRARSQRRRSPAVPRFDLLGGRPTQLQQRPEKAEQGEEA